MEILLYNYDDKGLFTHSNIAALDPLEEEATPLVPRNATLLEPPVVAENQVAVFENNQWQVVADYRGKQYWSANNGLIVIDQITVEPPIGTVELNPGEVLIQNDDDTWRLRTNDDDLNDYKANKILELTESFNTDLNAGFTSNSLGADHRYDSEQHNRENLIGAVAAGVDQPYTCDDLLSNPDSKIQRMHTAAQLKQVLVDGAAYKQTLIAKLRLLRTQVADAIDGPAVDAVLW